jgi:single-strand DNA-binding protein
MPSKAHAPAALDADDVPTYSEVRLRGRLSGATAITLPSGDEAVTFRVIVDRPARQRGPAGRVRVDALECIAWTAATRRRVLSCHDGDAVEVEGSLQRRFWRTGAGLASRTEVLAREVRRAA